MPEDLQFQEFFASQFGQLRRLGFWLTGNWGQAEELAQDALVRTYGRWRWVRSHDRPEDYARKVLLNRVPLAAASCGSRGALPLPKPSPGKCLAASS